MITGTPHSSLTSCQTVDSFSPHDYFLNFSEHQPCLLQHGIQDRMVPMQRDTGSLLLVCAEVLPRCSYAGIERGNCRPLRCLRSTNQLFITTIECNISYTRFIHCGTLSIGNHLYADGISDARREDT